MNTGNKKLKELDKLEEYLKENDIDYNRYDSNECEMAGERHQIKIYEGDFEKEQSIICHPYSYGYDEGLLEGMGSLFENGNDNVIGWMTADDVIKRIKNNKVRYSPYKEMNLEISESIDKLEIDVRSVFSGIKAQIDYVIRGIQKDNMSIKEVEDVLKQLSDGLDV